jgi:hypothetical protein
MSLDLSSQLSRRSSATIARVVQMSVLLSAVAIGALACGPLPASDDGGQDAPSDAGSLDGGLGDAGPGDAGEADGGAIDAGEGDGGGCLDVEACAGTCGPVRDACGETVACGPCVDEEDLDVLLAPVRALIEVFETYSYMSDIVTIDLNAIIDEATTLLFDSPDTDVALLTAMARGMRAFRNGHSGFYLASQSCFAAGGAFQGWSRYGVCASPKGDDFVVTHQPGASNPLGLEPGDRVLALNGISGEPLIEHILDAPLCGNGAGNFDVMHDHAASSLFAILKPGDVLEVRRQTGALQEIVVGEPTAGAANCRYPAGPTTTPMISATLRDDGVAVMRLTRFTLFEGEPGYLPVVTEADANQLIANMTAQIHDVFLSVAGDAIGMIWDVRGNIGGASRVGFAIASGMPGATATPLARCTTRIPGSIPVAYNAFGPDYDIAPDAEFAFAGPVAILTDGQSISAADYFALAAKESTSARLFGRKTAGAYGGGGAGLIVDEERGYYVAYDPYRCNDLAGDALETRSVEPHVLVDYEPDDLAIGVDTVEEAAAAWILSEVGN